MTLLPRRQFLVQTVTFASSSLLGMAFEACGKAPERNRNISRVVKCVRSELFPSGRRLDVTTAKELLKPALSAWFDLADFSEGLSALFRPSDRVALKVNCLSGNAMSTHPLLVWAFIKLLQESGVKADSITIWDRADDDLLRAGFKLNSSTGVKVLGVDRSGYTADLIQHRSIGSFLAKTVIQADKIVNFPVLKDHGIVGVTLSLKNFFGAIHNPNKYHLNNGDPYIADLFSYPAIKDKVVLNIVDGIVGQYEGGPPPMPQWQWNFAGILCGSDPVAVDRIGLDIIETARAKNGLMSLTEASRFPAYLKTAEKVGLGNFDRARINLIEI